jgi:hypothetical protein
MSVAKAALALARGVTSVVWMTGPSCASSASKASRACGRSMVQPLVAMAALEGNELFTPISFPNIRTS